jgi:hypothetical protein
MSTIASLKGSGFVSGLDVLLTETEIISASFLSPILYRIGLLRTLDSKPVRVVLVLAKASLMTDHNT